MNILPACRAGLGAGTWKLQESLFTNALIEGLVQVTLWKLESDPCLADCTTLTPTQIADLLNFVLRPMYFHYDRAIYEQQDSTAMGSPVYAVIANLYTLKNKLYFPFQPNLREMLCWGQFYHLKTKWCWKFSTVSQCSTTNHLFINGDWEGQHISPPWHIGHKRFLRTPHYKYLQENYSHWSIPVSWLTPPSTSWMKCCQVLKRLIKKYHHQLGDDIFPSIIELSAISEEIDTPIIQESAGI